MFVYNPDVPVTHQPGSEQWTVPACPHHHGYHQPCAADVCFPERHVSGLTCRTQPFGLVSLPVWGVYAHLCVRVCLCACFCRCFGPLVPQQAFWCNGPVPSSSLEGRLQAWAAVRSQRERPCVNTCRAVPVWAAYV